MTTMRCGTVFALGDIVLIAFPFSGSEGAKQRPAVVLKKLDRHGDFLALPLTTKAFYECAFEVDDTMLSAGSLPKKSWVRYDKIATLKADQVLGRVATLNEAVFDRLNGVVCGFLGCLANS